jgi:hypothetical protein
MALLPLTSISADGTSDRLRELLGDGTYEAAGLDLLSEQEQAVLEAWINGRLAQRPVPMPGATVSYSSGGQAPAARTVAEASDSDRPEDLRPQIAFGIDFSGQESMESTIDGEFNGWRGDTVFRLANGTVWQQVDGERLVVGRPEMNPEVTIERGYFGYRMRVEGHNRRVQVRRVE